MKKIYIALFALLAVGSTFTACTEEEARQGAAAAKGARGHGRFLAARVDGRRCRRRQRSGAGA